MAAVYNPWNYSGTEDVTEDGLVTPVFMEQADMVEDAAEGETPQTEEESAPAGNSSGDILAIMSDTMKQQSSLISNLMTMLSQKP